MADTGSIPSFQKAVDIISDAFSILDFSYFISGSVAYAIIYGRLKLASYDFSVFHIDLWVKIIFSLIVIYVLGIVASSMGGIVRKFFGIHEVRDPKNIICVFERIPKKILFKTQNYLWVSTKREIELCTKTFGGIKDDHKKHCLPNGINTEINILYTFVWNALSKNNSANDRIRFINRFWVMQKVYEGLMADCILFLFLVFNADKEILSKLPMEQYWIYFTVIICFFTFAYEAALNFKTQVREAIMAYYTYSFNNATKKED